MQPQTADLPLYNSLMNVASAKADKQRSGFARWVSVAFLLVSFLVSLAFLGTRNIYDDEITSANLLPVSTRQIIATVNSQDVHPPGMYVLAHLGYQLIPSARWVTLFLLSVLYVGLAIFVLSFAPLFHDVASRLCFILFATLHPQLLMWGNSIRWYPWWTGIALIIVVVAIRPQAPEPASFSTRRALALGLLLGCLFYVNYITILFSVALVAALVFRYGWHPWKQYIAVAATTLALVAPQLHAFLTVHMQGSKGQRSNLLLSLARLIQAIFTSEAYLPWHPMAIFALLIFLVLSVLGIIAAVHMLWNGSLSTLRERSGAVASIVLLALIFFVLVAISGLGGKPRNALLLVPLLAPAVAIVVGGIRSRLAQYAVLCVLMVWSAGGIIHLLRREGLAKAGMNNRPEEVLSFIENSRGAECSVVLTYDPVLTFYLVESKLPRQMVLAYSQNTIYRNAVPFSVASCPAIELYVVQSYTGGFGEAADRLPLILQQASWYIQGPVQTHSFSLDQDASIKRRLSVVSGASTLPDYRYVVASGQLAPSDLTKLENQSSLFKVADGHSE